MLFLYKGATPKMIQKAAALPGQKFYALIFFNHIKGLFFHVFGLCIEGCVACI